MEKWLYEFYMLVTAANGNTYHYVIEADTAEDAFAVAEEFFNDDYPDEELVDIEIVSKERIN